MSEDSIATIPGITILNTDDVNSRSGHSGTNSADYVTELIDPNSKMKTTASHRHRGVYKCGNKWKVSNK